jgi:hypothetical protein
VISKTGSDELVQRIKQISFAAFLAGATGAPAGTIGAQQVPPENRTSRGELPRVGSIQCPRGPDERRAGAPAARGEKEHGEYEKEKLGGKRGADPAPFGVTGIG